MLCVCLPTCRYQSTQLQLYATWLNGGNGGPPDYVSLVDVSRLAANWTSDQPQALRISGTSAVVSPSRIREVARASVPGLQQLQALVQSIAPNAAVHQSHAVSYDTHGLRGMVC